MTQYWQLAPGLPQPGSIEEKKREKTMATKLSGRAPKYSHFKEVMLFAVCIGAVL